VCSRHDVCPLILTIRSEYTPQPSDTKFGWIKNFRGLNDDHVLMHSSLDNYLFLRLFKILFTICLVGAIITWPILFPVNATGMCFWFSPLVDLSLTNV